MQKILLLVTMSLAAIACGGGGGGSSAAQLPTNTTATAASNTAIAPTNNTTPATQSWDLRRVSPSVANTSQANVNAVLDHIFIDHAVQSVLVSKYGLTIGERYATGYDKDSYGTSWSVAKSFYSAAIGVAIDEALIGSVDDKVSDIITEWQNTDKADITLKQVLQMRGGYSNQDNIFNTSDQTAHAISFPLASTPGTQFSYSNANSQVFEPILYRATGLSAHQYLANKVLAPIGINTNNVGFWLDASGTNPMTYCCLDMRPDDFARFGLLFARGGAWDGEQIISQNYVSQSMTANGTYGYQWWILNSAYWNGRQVAINITAALGLNGQKIYIWPEQDIVIVVLTKYTHSANQGYVLDIQGSVTNFPDTCTARNACPGAQDPEVPSFNEYELISLIQALGSN
ncbi:beta-lactamase family protein [Pseudomonadales bacterium]|nr:beta-lactamase family protein [Pseudomonadales bacterium]